MVFPGEMLDVFNSNFRMMRSENTPEFHYKIILPLKKILMQVMFNKPRSLSDLTTKGIFFESPPLKKGEKGGKRLKSDRLLGRQR
jgi:hypothetical protein